MDERLQALGGPPGSLANLVAELADADLDTGIDESSPTIRQILALVRERESARWRLALEHLLASSVPPPFDEDAWRAAVDISLPGKRRLLGDIALQRQSNINRLQQIDPTAWRTMAISHGETHTSLADLVDQWIDADREAIEAIERILGRTLTEVLEHRFAHRDEL
jgi:hypothetical protein